MDNIVTPVDGVCSYYSQEYRRHKKEMLQNSTTYICELVDRTLIGVSVAGTLASNGDITDAVEVPSKTQFVDEVVSKLLILDGHPKPLQSDPDEASLGEIHQCSRGSWCTGPAIDQTDMDLNKNVGIK